MRDTYHIIKESFPVVTLAALLSSIGAVGLEYTKEKVLLILPLLILIPTLNDMVGDYGATFASKFTLWLRLGKVPEDWRHSRRLWKLFLTLLGIGLFFASSAAISAAVLAYLRGYPLALTVILRLLIIASSVVVVMLLIMSVLIVTVGIKLWKKGKDPDNYLIPIATAVADLGVLLIFSLLVNILF